MTFSEMKQEYDKYHAYDSFYSIEYMKKAGRIPEKYHDIIPDKCQCGSELMMSTSLTQPQCCDPLCKVKQGYMLAEMLKRFGFKGLGVAKCSDILSACWGILKYQSYVETLLLKPEQLPYTIAMSAAGRDFITAINYVKQKPLPFYRIIANLGIPYIGLDICEKLFNKVNSCEQYLDLVEKEGGLQQYCVNRGIYDLLIPFWLHACHKHIVVGSVLFKSCTRLCGIEPLPICITGNVILDGCKITKDKFIGICNRVCITSDGVQLYEIKKTEAMQTNEFIVASVPNYSIKYNAGLEREKHAEALRARGFTAPKILVTPDELIEILKARVSAWEEEVKYYEEEHNNTEVDNKSKHVKAIDTFE